MTTTTPHKYEFYTVSLKANCEDSTHFIYTALLKDNKVQINNTSTNGEFFNNSKLLAFNNVHKNPKLLFVLHKPELYYSDNYKHFDYFRQSFNGCIDVFNSFSIEKELLQDNKDWLANIINDYLAANKN